MTEVSRDTKAMTLRLDAALVDTIDSLRGDTPRTVWITRAIENAMATGLAMLPDLEIDTRELTKWGQKRAAKKLAFAEHSALSQDCHTTQHNRAKARHGRCEDCGERP